MAPLPRVAHGVRGECYPHAVPFIPALAERIARRTAAARQRADELRAMVPGLASRLRAMGATRVRLFGSLAAGATPHEDTDIDLCVEGLDEGSVGDALLEFERLPARVDLVRSESAGDRLRRRIDADAVEVPG
jgi:predicted nucleotidyltransferase